MKQYAKKSTEAWFDNRVVGHYKFFLEHFFSDYLQQLQNIFYLK